MTIFLALDVGTTAAKCVALDESGAVLANASGEYKLVIDALGNRTQDPDAVWAQAINAIRGAVEQLGGKPVAALALSAAVHALAAADADGRLLTPLITWADSRAEYVARALVHTELGEALHRETGTPIHPMSPLMKLCWFAQEQPDFQPAQWWGIKEFIVWQLTGVRSTEVSSASASGLAETATGRWSRMALETAGIDESQLAPINNCTDQLPLSAAAASELGLPTGLPVVLGGGDGPLANIGSGAYLPDRIGITLGTSGAVRRVAYAPGIGEQRSRFCYSLGMNTWVVGRAQSNGSSALRWASRNWAPHLVTPAGGVDDQAVLELAATAPEGSEGLQFAPFLLPERTPRWEQYVTARLDGLRAEHTTAHLLRACIEGVAEALAAMARDVASDVEGPTYWATGGAFCGQLWRDALVRALGHEVNFSDDAEGTARGAAMMAAISLGIAEDIADAATKLGAPTSLLHAQNPA